MINVDSEYDELFEMWNLAISENYQASKSLQRTCDLIISSSKNGKEPELQVTKTQPAKQKFNPGTWLLESWKSLIL